MKVLVTGSSGLIGSALVEQLRRGGHKVVRLVRGATSVRDATSWDPAAGTMASGALQGVEGVVHLAGAPVAAKRWTKRVKREILESRLQSTRLLADALVRLPQRPGVLVSASGVGIYGDRGEAIVDESSAVGAGFLAEVAQQWEAATAPAAKAGIRVATMRLGMVLSMTGGALPRMTLPFRWGLGGPVGSGRQMVSWITLDDAVSAIRFVLENDGVSGPVNTVAPGPVTNREFATTLGHVLHRPSYLPLPAWVVRLMLGQMGRELLLASTRAVPRTLESAGFRFRYDNLDAGLRHVLSRVSQ